MPTVSAEGALVLDGTLQTVHENLENKVLEGAIDLSSFIAGDTVLFRLETRVKSGGAYVKTGADRTFNGPVGDQDKMLSFQPRAHKYGYRVSVQQTLGPFRTIDFIFFKT